MKPTTPSPTLLPARVDSSVLAKFRHPGEPLILVKLVGVGNSAPYDFHGKGTRSFVFRHESQQEGHILRVPLHLWQENKARLAHDLMDQRRLPHAIIVTLEEPPPTPTSSIPADTQMGATDTRTETRNVVGPGSEPTVAPTCAGEGSPACPQAAAVEAPDTQATPPTQTTQRELPSQTRTTAASIAATAPSTSTDATAAPSPLSVAATTLQAEAPPLIAGRPLHEAAYDLLESPKRLKALAALLGVAEPALRAAIPQPGSRIELAPAGWIRRKA